MTLCGNYSFTFSVLIEFLRFMRAQYTRGKFPEEGCGAVKFSCARFSRSRDTIMASSSDTLRGRHRAWRNEAR